MLATEGSAPGVVSLPAGTRRQDQSHFMTPGSCQPTQSQHGDLTDSAAKLTTVTEPYGDPISRTRRALTSHQPRAPQNATKLIHTQTPSRAHQGAARTAATRTTTSTGSGSRPSRDPAATGKILTNRRPRGLADDSRQSERPVGEKLAAPAKRKTDTPNHQFFAYVWAIPHATWNALMHALHGNTTLPGVHDRVAIWWPGDGIPDSWYTGRVTGRSTLHPHLADVQYDCDGNTFIHDLINDCTWRPQPHNRAS